MGSIFRYAKNSFSSLFRWYVQYVLPLEVAPDDGQLPKFTLLELVQYQYHNFRLKTSRFASILVSNVSAVLHYRVFLYFDTTMRIYSDPETATEGKVYCT